jgi:hypothetical protein
VLGVLPRQLDRLTELPNAGAHSGVTRTADLDAIRRQVLGIGEDGLLARVVRVGMRGRG